jgi:hypothetical protein
MRGVETAVSPPAVWVLGSDFKFKHGADYTTSQEIGSFLENEPIWNEPILGSVGK